MSDHRREVEVIAAWMRFLMGDAWGEETVAASQVALFLSGRHNVDAAPLVPLVRRALARPRDLRVSTHAVRRFQERTGTKKRHEHIAQQIRKMAEFAEMVELKQEFRLSQLLSHKSKQATYLNADGLILVVVDGEIQTVHFGEAKKWTPPAQ